MLNFIARVILAFKFYTRLAHVRTWRQAWLKSKRDTIDEHADYHHAGTL